jgi:hypothetical protein
MPAAVLTPEAWAEVRRASEAGADDESLSRRYGIKQTAIRKRRSTETWMTPERVHAEAVKAKLEDSHKRVATGTISRISQEPTTATEVIGSSIAEMQEVYPLVASRYALQKLQESVTKDLLPAPDSWKTFAAADQILRRNLGLDKPTAEVNLSLWTAQTPQPERDVTPSSVESVSDEWLE